MLSDIAITYFLVTMVVVLFRVLYRERHMGETNDLRLEGERGVEAVARVVIWSIFWPLFVLKALIPTRRWVRERLEWWIRPP
jgi:hypothetical protein